MMMLDYNGGRGVKNLRKSDYVTCERSLISTVIHKNMESNILANTFQQPLLKIIIYCCKLKLFTYYYGNQ